MAILEINIRKAQVCSPHFIVEHYSALTQQLRPVSLTSWRANCCILCHGKLAFYNNGFLAATFEFNFAEKAQLKQTKPDMCVFKTAVSRLVASV